MGKKTREPRYPDPTNRAEELVDKGATASSKSEVPCNKHVVMKNKIRTAFNQPGHADDTPFTETELQKSSSPEN